ncbi:MAG: MarR family EPS-associated transcriptional regulator [Venatoribacter sp.]
MNEIDLQTLCLAPQEPSQRSLAEKLGFSIGKTNYILKGLIEKGYIKAERFINSDNKAGYRYVLTPSGIKERIRLTEAFIERKKHEYEELKRDLEELKNRRGGL